jgi:hypothetical protein
MNTSAGNEAISNTDLRKFGLMTSVLLILFFVILIPWIWNLAHPLWPWVVGAVLSAIALVAPAGLRPVYRIWMRFAEALGWVNTRIILSLIFFLIFVPFGLLMRLFNDPMRRKTDTGAASYRVLSSSPKRENMERPF